MAEFFLKQGLSDARQARDEGAQLAILSELRGYCRTFGRHGESMEYVGQALSLTDPMGLAGTLHYGTLLLNAATACRAAGRFAEAERLYQQTDDICRSQLTSPDYRSAFLCNNKSILSSETGRLEEVLYRKSDLESAVLVCETALTKIEKNCGHNRSWQITEYNLQGLLLSKNYYEAYGKPMIASKFGFP